MYFEQNWTEHLIKLYFYIYNWKLQILFASWEDSFDFIQHVIMEQIYKTWYVITRCQKSNRQEYESNVLETISIQQPPSD